jgi:N-acetyl-gamma-glutamyl-phosphate reductase
MKAITGLSREPLFIPIVANYYSGIVVSIPIYTEYLKKYTTPEQIHQFLTDYYANQLFIQVMPYGHEAAHKNFINSNMRSNWDGMKIYVTGNSDRILLTSQFDNLGKGASGAAIHCFNILTSCKEDKGLHL